jgi:hypothetical protein
MRIVTLEEARTAGLARYYTGKPCRRGHFSERQAANKTCLECKRECAATWHKSHLEHAREVRRTWESKHREQRRVAARERYRANLNHSVELSRRSYKRRRAKWNTEHAQELGRQKPEACECCGQSTKRIVWDHNHKTGCGRGWICDSCNYALGHVGDSPARLLQLLKYLQRCEARAEVIHGENLILPFEHVS